MDLKQLTPAELAEQVTASEDKEFLRAVATHLGAGFSGNTGIPKLKESILAEIIIDAKPDAVSDAPAPAPAPTGDEDTPTHVVEDDPTAKALHDMLNSGPSEEEVEIAKVPERSGPTIEEMMEMNPAEIEDFNLRRAVIRAQNLRLIRCQVVNMDPNDAEVPGAIVTVTNKYTGKQSKYIPFGEENEAGYHIPKILLDELKSRTYNLRKEVKNKNGSFGIKTYKTVKMPKFNIIELDPLTPEELQAMALRQAAGNNIG